MAIIISMLFQIIVLLAAGLFMTTFTHQHLKSEAKIIGISHGAAAIILGFSPWMASDTPLHVDLYFAVLFTSILLFAYTLIFRISGKLKFMLLAVFIPIGMLYLLKFKPYLVSFNYNSIILTSIATGFVLIGLIYLIKLGLSRFYNIYAGLIIIALLLASINYGDNMIIAATSFFIFSECLALLHIRNEINRSYKEANHEASYYKDQFESAVEKEVKKRTFYMELSKEKMQQLNRTDHLTKLLNRKSILSDIESLLLDRSTAKFVMFVFDIDYFKNINDTQGHAAGDTCLKNLAGILKAHSRDYDLLGRYGGDEFLIILPNLGYKEGLAYGESLLQEVHRNTSPKFTISMGMAVYPWDGETYKQLFEIADRGLYQAKAEGRNRIGYKGYIRA